jgi:hypothetical protein
MSRPTFGLAKTRIKLSLCLTNKTLRHEDVWGSGDIAPSFLTSAPDGGEWSASCLCRFTPPPPGGGESPRYPFYRRLGGPQRRSGRCGEEKNLAPAVQPVARRYKGWAKVPDTKLDCQLSS